MDYEKEYKKLVARIKSAKLYAQSDSTKAVLNDILPDTEIEDNSDSVKFDRIKQQIQNEIDRLDKLEDEKVAVKDYAFASKIQGISMGIKSAWHIFYKNWLN